MRKLTLMAATAGVICATAAFAAPVPSGALGIDRGDHGSVVQVKTKKMKKKKMMNQGGMSSQGTMGQGNMSQPSMGGSAGAGQPMSSPSQKQ